MPWRAAAGSWGITVSGGSPGATSLGLDLVYLRWGSQYHTGSYYTESQSGASVQRASTSAGGASQQTWDYLHDIVMTAIIVCSSLDWVHYCPNPVAFWIGTTLCTVAAATIQRKKLTRCRHKNIRNFTTHECLLDMWWLIHGHLIYSLRGWGGNTDGSSNGSKRQFQLV
ncbi:hypothetical protein F5B21DRAFT_334087 [Xylaria acuta]|nr:hypothetical protein F5B21DRAFT_334087 [Xylaria acuta]